MTRTPMPSLREIARRTNLSVGTVSRVLRNTGEVLPETRQRVLDVAQELKYRPNLLMVSVAKGKTKTVGVLVEVADAFGGKIVAGIHDKLTEMDHVPILLWSDWDSPKELAQIHRLVDRRVDGVILRPVSHTVSDAYFREVWERNIPLVTVDTELAWTHTDFVGTDDLLGSRLAAEHLLALGHRRLGQLAGPLKALNSQNRAQAFEKTLAAYPGATCVTVENTFFDNGLEKARALLNRTPRPTAIFAATDFLAKDVYQAAQEMGLQVPRDLSVVGYADFEFSTWMHPTLTTIRQDPYTIGYKAAELVLNRSMGILDDAAQKQTIRLKPELVIRGSTGPIA